MKEVSSKILRTVLYKSLFCLIVLFSPPVLCTLQRQTVDKSVYMLIKDVF